MADIKKTYAVRGMHCAGCAANIERVLGKREGVKLASVNFPSSTVLVEYDPAVISYDGLREAVENAGFELGADEEEEESDHSQEEEYGRLKRNTI